MEHEPDRLTEADIAEARQATSAALRTEHPPTQQPARSKEHGHAR